jgi:hypothetical protein
MTLRNQHAHHGLSSSFAVAMLCDASAATGFVHPWPRLRYETQNIFIHFFWNNFFMALTVTTLSFTLAAATPTLLLPLDTTRRSLLRATTGTAPAVWKFGSAPTSATDGVVLDSTSAVGGRLLATGDQCPVDPVYAYSTAGTTVTVEVGRANGA